MPDDSDALSFVLERLSLSAQVTVNAKFCGLWGVDTAGTRRVPFHIVAEGSGWLHLEDESPKVVKQGDLVVFPTDGHHVLSGDAEPPPEALINHYPEEDQNLKTTRLVCGFFDIENRLFWPVLDGLPSSIHITAEHHSMRGLLDLLVDEACAERAGHQAMLNHLAAALFVMVLRQASTDVSTGLLAAFGDRQIGAALNALHHNIGGNWDIPKLANAAGLGRSAFTSRFTNLIGISPAKYLKHWRMQEAIYQLTHSDISIASLSETLGYTEPAFRTTFKEVVGMTPKQMRNSVPA